MIAATSDDNSAPKWKLGLTFHRTFSLIRPALKQVLDLSIETENSGDSDGIEHNLIREFTNLGTIYVEAMPRYGYGAGLLNKQYLPTVFGKFAHEHDPLLDQTSTQWLIHYHLSSPSGPGPEFWNELVRTYFRAGFEFKTTEIVSTITDVYERSEGKKLADRSAKATATIFLGTYTKSDGLANLNIIQSTGPDSYRISEDIEPPPTWAVAYAILDYWKSQFPGRTTVNLDDFSAENGLADIFLIGAGKIANILQKMQAEGFVDVFRVAPPYQVVLLKPEIDVILEKLYAHE